MALINPNSFSTVPLLRNLAQSEQLRLSSQQGLNNLAALKARLAASQPTGEIPSIAFKPATTSSTSFGKILSQKTGIQATPLLKRTVPYGMAPVILAGILGAVAIQSASKKTKKVQDQYTAETMAVADDLIKNIRAMRPQQLQQISSILGISGGF